MSQNEQVRSYFKEMSPLNDSERELEFSCMITRLFTDNPVDDFGNLATS
jgi:hypothetical protein